MYLVSLFNELPNKNTLLIAHNDFSRVSQHLNATVDKDGDE